MVTITASSRETTYHPVSPTTDFPCVFPIFGRNVGEFPATDLQVEVNGEVTTAFTVVATFADGISTNALVRLSSGVTGEVIVRGKRTPRRTDQYANGAALRIPDHNYSLNRLESEMQEVRRDASRASDGLDNERLERIAADSRERSERISGDQNLDGRIYAVASLVGQAGAIEVPMFDTRLAVTFAEIKPTINAIRTGGHSMAGDGGHALYKRVASEPSHAGKIQSADDAWWEFAENEVNLFQVGAKGDALPMATGTGTDDTQAFIDARDIAVALGINCRIPALPENRAFRATQRLDFSDECSWIGFGADVTHDLTVNRPNGGSWIYFDHVDEGMRFRDETTPSNSKKTSRIRSFGVCRNQPTPASGWTPTDHGADFRVEFNVDADDILFLNSARWFHIRSAGQLQNRRLRGQALIVGIYCERSSDVQRWEGPHFWPYWSQDANVKAYTIANTIAISVLRADGLMIDTPFSIWCKRLFKAEDATGISSGLSNFHISQPYADVGGGGIEIISNFYAAYGRIDGYLCNSNVDGAPSEGAAFRLSGSVASQIDVEIRSNRSPAEVIYVSGAAHKVNVRAGRFNGWAFVTTGRYMVRVTDGAIIEFANTPQFLTGNGLYYSQDSTSQIILPVKYPLAYAAAVPNGIHSNRISIADDAVSVFAAPAGNKTCLLMLVPASVPGAGTPAGSVWCRATGTPSIAVVSLSHTANVVVTTGVLTGTTGTDGNLTISAASDGNIYIENRTGSSKAFDLTMVGS